MSIESTYGIYQLHYVFVKYGNHLTCIIKNHVIYLLIAPPLFFQQLGK